MTAKELFTWFIRPAETSIHTWFDGSAWPRETIGTCTSPPVLRVGKTDKLLHVVAGRSLTYHYRSASGWHSYPIGYYSDDYDMQVANARPIIAFLSPSYDIYKAQGDTLGNFTVTIVDSSYTVDYPPYYRSTYSIRGPVSIYSAAITILYSTIYNYKRYKVKEAPRAPNYCTFRYGDLEYEHLQYYEGYMPCTYLVEDVASESPFLVYYNSKRDFIRTYPMNDTIKGLFWGPDICYTGSYLMSAIGQDDRFPYLIHGTEFYPVDTVGSLSITSIVATDSKNVFIAYVSRDTIVRVAYGSIPGTDEEPTPWPGLLLGSVVLRGPSQSGGYIRFTTGAEGFMDCRLYTIDGTRAYLVAREVREGEEVRIPVGDLGAGVYYLRVEIAGYRGLFRVIVL